MEHFKALMETHLFTLAGTAVNVITLAAALLIVILTLFAAHFADRSTERLLVARKVTPHGSIEATARLVHYLVLGIGFATAVHTLGIKLTSLFTAGAMLAVGVGFAMQNIMQNFVSGLILLTERSITPDDVLEVGGEMVRVTTLDMRSTVANNRDLESLILPNSTLVGSTVKNYTLHDSKVRIGTVIGVAYESDMKQVRSVLEATLAALPWRVQDIEPTVRMTEFASSSVNFTLKVGIDDPWLRNSMISQLNEAVWFALKDAGITIAYPQLDVHMYEEGGGAGVVGSGAGA